MGEGIVGMWSEERGERLTMTVISLHAEDGERLSDFKGWVRGSSECGLRKGESV